MGLSCAECGSNAAAFSRAAFGTEGQGNTGSGRPWRPQQHAQHTQNHKRQNQGTKHQHKRARVNGDLETNCSAVWRPTNSRTRTPPITHTQTHSAIPSAMPMTPYAVFGWNGGRVAAPQQNTDITPQNAFFPFFASNATTWPNSSGDVNAKPVDEFFCDSVKMVEDVLTANESIQTQPQNTSFTHSRASVVQIDEAVSPFPTTHYAWPAAPKALADMWAESILQTPPQQHHHGAMAKKSRSRGKRKSGLIGRCKKSVVLSIKDALARAIALTYNKHEEYIEAANTILSLHGDEGFSDVLSCAAKLAAAEGGPGPFSALSSLLHGQLMKTMESEDEQQAEYVEVLMNIKSAHQVDHAEIQRVTSVSLCEKWLPADIREVCANGVALLCVEGLLPASFITKTISYAAEASLQHLNDAAGHLGSACTVLEKVAEAAMATQTQNADGVWGFVGVNALNLFSLSLAEFAPTFAGQISKDFCCGEMVADLRRAADVHKNNFELTRRVDRIARIFCAAM